MLRKVLLSVACAALIAISVPFASGDPGASNGFLAACFNPFAGRRTRAQVKAIRSWAERKFEAHGCVAASRILAETETVEIEDAGLPSLSLLAEARNVKRVYVAGNAVSDVSFLAGLLELEALDLRGNPVDEIPERVLARLRVLNVSGTRIRGLDALSAATSLVELHAHATGLTRLEGLSAFPSLLVLGLADNALASLEGIGAAESLRYLYVAGNRLASLEGIEALPALTFVNAQRNPLESRGECPHPTATCLME